MESSEQGLRHYGVNAKTIKVDEDTFKERLDEGNLIVVNVGPGDFTDNGHFMVITGYDDEGFTINDPNSIIKSNTHWQFERLQFADQGCMEDVCIDNSRTACILC